MLRVVNTTGLIYFLTFCNLNDILNLCRWYVAMIYFIRHRHCGSSRHLMVLNLLLYLHLLRKLHQDLICLLLILHINLISILKQRCMHWLVKLTRVYLVALHGLSLPGIESTLWHLRRNNLLMMLMKMWNSYSSLNPVLRTRA